MAACYAQAGRMDEAQKVTQRFHQLCSEEVDFKRYASNHARICKRQEDADHWIVSYRKAGLLELSGINRNAYSLGRVKFTANLKLLACCFLAYRGRAIFTSVF